MEKYTKDRVYELVRRVIDIREEHFSSKKHKREEKQDQEKMDKGFIEKIKGMKHY